METTIAVTNNWQIHIPKALRSILGMKKPGRIKAVAKKGKLIITPAPQDLLRLGGSLNKLYKKKPIDIDKVRDYIDYSQT